MKRLLTILALLLVVAIAGCTGRSQETTTDDTNNETQYSGTGTVAVAMKDKPIANVGEVSRIDITVRSIQVHSSSQATVNESTNETEIEGGGWVTVFSGTKTINLLDYANGSAELFGTTNISAGNYQQIRLYVDSATMTTANGTQTLDVPKTIRIVKGFSVESNQTTLLTIDWEVDNAISATGNGTYRMRPTFRVDEEDNVNLATKANLVIGTDLRSRLGVNASTNTSINTGLGIGV